MPQVSNKGLSMPASPIRKLVPYAEKAKQEGKKIFHLNIGQPDIETPETMLNAIHTFSPKVVEYSHSAGIESYRRKLTEYYHRYQIELDYTDIMITTGGSEAIEIAMMSCLNEGEKVITSKTKAIMICNPNNPTGYLYSKSELESLREIVARHDLWFFSDEVY